MRARVEALQGDQVMNKFFVRHAEFMGSTMTMFPLAQNPNLLYTAAHGSACFGIG
eukprot:SAG11_NODE_38165_length_253_cov_1.168831_1_plen_54_part_10